MGKPVVSRETQVFCGVDVSAATLAVAVQPELGPGCQQREFANTAAGHRRLIAWLGRLGARARVSLEATGIYSLDLAVALARSEGVEVAVLNPRRVRQFARTLGRSKTDAADAVALAEYSRRMPFQAWQAPPAHALELRAISRHIATLVAQQAQLKNRLHAAEASAATPRCVRQDLRRSMAGLDKRVARLRRQAEAVVRSDSGMERKFEHLLGVPGIARASAIALLGELAGLDPEMTVRQWVAHSGLDPAHHLSGSSVHPPSRISRQGNGHLRRALYMPALAAIRCDPHLKAFYHLLQSRQKANLQALVAVARKMLHAIFGIFKNNHPYDGARLFPNLNVNLNVNPKTPTPATPILKEAFC
jgi:transposase